MAQQYDLVVIGTGTAGSSVAMRCREAGWRVAIVDARPFGGTCSQRGCDPKKVLVHAAHLLEQARRLEGRGLAWSEGRIDWPALMRFKKTFTDDIPARTRQKFAEAGIDAFHGQARFSGPQEITVSSHDGADEVLRAEKIHLATGAKPTPLGIEGEERFTYSDDFLEMDRLPKRLVFVGGGYISMEFAHLAARAGAREIHVLETGERPLQNFEADLVEVLLEATRALGIKVHTGQKVQAIEEKGGALEVVAEDDSGAEKRYAADRVVHGAGRVPQLDKLDLEAGHVDTEDGRLALNPFLQSTSNPAVYAAGDAAQAGPPLTPTAALDADAVAENLLSGNTCKPDHSATPAAVFCTPRLAAVGLSEEEARAAGADFETGAGDASQWYTARHRRAEHAAYKVLVEKGSGKILGAHLVYPNAEEIINLFAMAMRHGLTADDLRDTLYAYPSAAHDLAAMLP